MNDAKWADIKNIDNFKKELHMYKNNKYIKH